MDISQLRKNYVFTTKIEIDDENWIEFREPAQYEIVKLNGNEENMLQLLEDLFPDCMIASSFTKGDRPATGKEVYDELKESASLLMNILTEWLESVPFQSRLKNKKNSSK